MSEKEKLISEFTEFLLGERSDDPAEWAQKTLDSGLSPINFFNEVFTPAMTAVGDKFGRLEIYLPELIDAAETAKRIIEQVIDPLLAEQNSGAATTKGKVLLCAVKGDLHDIGKNMVSLMLQVNGFEVVDLGIDVDPRTIVERAKEENVDIVGLSALMTTSMLYMKDVVELRDGFGNKDDFSIILGGAPITAEYTAEVGADTFGKSAVEAVERCTALMERAATS